MNEIRKEWEITAEINDIFIEANAMRALRDQYIGTLFFEKRAIKYAIEYERLSQSAWKRVFILYPELKGKRDLSWKFSEGIVLRGEV